MNYFIIIAVLVTVDQVFKYLAQTFLKPVGTLPIVKNVFHLTYGQNTGAAFSILQGKQAFLIIITSIVTIALVVYLIKNYKTQNHLLLISLTLFISGALGNLTDRVRLNYVVDFLDFTLVNYPIFNTADIFVVSGSIFLAYFVLFAKSVNSRKDI
ncbi:MULTISPECIES: signal peptidase II [Desulfosporosinus]|uniref:Lipoprotein signal peptidase n=1 Tax=Desulfosporosinus metallidurans TaxID=1888891 RepID=A0A1Q8QTE4_9FIRM|nr:MULTISPECIES: signal peptidase II [Desulfosporosinus]MDI6878325.1 signal peptidase II [Desulfitobacteriaceae bacterium]MDI6912600.1 signal peptidase II [Desulfitobacteriaceae bacterium]OLN30621.1 Lipoprotein signal peptidase [Desulfosporosinus metallidurans]